MILDFILWFAIGYNIASVISSSFLTRKLRMALIVSDNSYLKVIGEFMNCIWCVSTWVFFILSANLYSPTEVAFSGVGFWFSVFCSGMIGAFFTYIFSRLEAKL